MLCRPILIVLNFNTLDGNQVSLYTLVQMFKCQTLNLSHNLSEKAILQSHSYQDLSDNKM